MLVRDAMLPNPLVLAPENSVLEFCRRVLESNQTTAVVIDCEQRLRGIVSVRDVFERVLPHYVSIVGRLAGVIREGYFDEKFEEFKHLAVSQIMTTEVNTLAPDDAVIQAVGAFHQHGHKTIPVLENGRFLGSITRRSVLRRVTDDAC